MAYGAAGGVDLSAGVGLLLAAAVGRRPRDDALIGLAVIAVLLAGAAGLLCWLQGSRARSQDLWALNQPFVLATLSAFVPLVWCLAARPSPRMGDADLGVAVLYLAVAGLFVANRYDSLVASGAIDSPFVEPFVFPVAIAGVGLRHQVRHLVDLERSFRELRLAQRVTKLVDSAADRTTAVAAVLALLARKVGALAGVAVVRGPNGHRDMIEWPRSPSDAAARAAMTVAKRAVTAFDRPVPDDPGGVRVHILGEHAVAAAPVTEGGTKWGALYLVGRPPAHRFESQGRVIDLVVREMGRGLGRLERLAAHDEQTAADERNRIAQELHDSVSQTLYSVAMVADALPGVLGQDPATATRYATQIRSMTLQALGDIRVLLAEMRESALESASLRALLEQMATAPNGLVTVEIDAVGDADLLPEVKLAAYRIAQQAVANARQHAAASEIVVRLRQRTGWMALSVSDDGTGFDVGAVPVGRHGLRIMHERAASVGADLRIDSQPGQGTRLRLTWPAPGGPSGQALDT